MYRIVTWIISTFIFLLFFLFYHSYVIPFDFSDIFEASPFISIVIMTVALISILVLLSALVPFRKLNYPRRLLVLLPYCIISVCVFLTAFFYSMGPGYKTIKGTTASCESVRNGIFAGYFYKVERKGTLQTDTDFRVGDTVEFYVRWISDNEYVLENGLDNRTVKIVEVTENGYACYVTSEGYTSSKYWLSKVKLPQD